jgi:hypothetical protein
VLYVDERMIKNSIRAIAVYVRLVMPFSRALVSSWHSAGQSPFHDRNVRGGDLPIEHGHVLCSQRRSSASRRVGALKVYCSRCRVPRTADYRCAWLFVISSRAGGQLCLHHQQRCRCAPAEAIAYRGAQRHLPIVKFPARRTLLILLTMLILHTLQSCSVQTLHHAQTHFYYK